MQFAGMVFTNRRLCRCLYHGGWYQLPFRTPLNYIRGSFLLHIAAGLSFSRKWQCKWVCIYSRALPYPDQSFDIVSIAFGINSKRCWIKFIGIIASWHIVPILPYWSNLEPPVWHIWHIHAMAYSADTILVSQICPRPDNHCPQGCIYGIYQLRHISK